MSFLYHRNASIFWFAYESRVNLLQYHEEAFLH